MSTSKAISVGTVGASDYIQSISWNPITEELEFVSVGAAHSANVSIPLSGAAADGVITDVVLNGTDLEFTGINGGFNGNIDLSSLITAPKDYIDNVVLAGTSLNFSRVGDAFTGAIDLAPIIPDNYVDDVELIGTDLIFTGVNSGFSGTIDLSSLQDGNDNDIDYIDDVQLVGTDLIFTKVGNAFAGTIDLSSLTGGGGGDPDQNLWETFVADSGSTTANTITDTLTIAGGTGISTEIVGDTLTITATGGGSLPTLEDEGSPVAGSPHNTYNFVGAGVSVTDAGGGEATITIAGGGGSNDGVVDSATLNGTVLELGRTEGLPDVTVDLDTLYIAQNGLTKLLNAFELGGNLYKDTTIDGEHPLIPSDYQILNIINLERGVIVSSEGSGFAVGQGVGTGLYSSGSHHTAMGADVLRINTGDGRYGGDTYRCTHGTSIGVAVGVGQLQNGNGIIDVNVTDERGAGIQVDADYGIGFHYKSSAASPQESYYFPKIDGTANQILQTDGAGQLSWVGGVSGSFTAQSGEVITVTNGLITSIV